jgi:hypothetical protein
VRTPSKAKRFSWRPPPITRGAAVALSETKLGALSNRSIAIMPRAAFATARARWLRRGWCGASPFVLRFP